MSTNKKVIGFPISKWVKRSQTRKQRTSNFTIEKQLYFKFTFKTITFKHPYYVTSTSQYLTAMYQMISKNMLL